MARTHQFRMTHFLTQETPLSYPTRLVLHSENPAFLHGHTHILCFLVGVENEPSFHVGFGNPVKKYQINILLVFYKQ